MLDELGEEIKSCAQMNVGVALLRALKGWRAVARVRRRSAGPPATTETLVVGPHSLTSDRDWEIRLYVHETYVATVPVFLKLTFTTDHASVLVSAGRIVSLRPGQITLEGLLKLSEDDRDVLARVSRVLTLPRSIRFPFAGSDDPADGTEPDEDAPAGTGAGGTGPDDAAGEGGPGFGAGGPPIPPARREPAPDQPDAAPTGEG